MNDESPFANFVPSSEAPAPAKPEKKSRRKSKKKPAETKAEPAKASAPAPKKVRKARKPQAAKIDMLTAMVALAGMKEDDCHVLEKIVTIISGAPKKSRSRVITALSKIFA